MPEAQNDARVEVRRFAELTDEEAETIREFNLRCSPKGMMPGWLQYRKHPDMENGYVALVWLDSELVSWAALVPGGYRIALAGALTDWRHQRRGYGRRALDAVLRHMAALERMHNGYEKFTHVRYTAAGQIFHPAIAEAGFGDFVTDPEEYRARYHRHQVG